MPATSQDGKYFAPSGSVSLLQTVGERGQGHPRLPLSSALSMLMCLSFVLCQVASLCIQACAEVTAEYDLARMLPPC